uniref:UL28 n=1 Tax=anatid alphaherpesvirus 1 TaxID=104388 RepID=A8DNQ7_9ALPH|nr:UL28 [Anatid alphaherpesvirus 1]
MEKNRGADRQHGAAAARQRLLATFGQLQTYIFQIELLKRCDPDVILGGETLRNLKLNAMMVRYLEKHINTGFVKQAEIYLTPMTYALHLSLRYAKKEGESVLAAIESYRLHGNIRKFFSDTMGLAGDCPYHRGVSLRTYGGEVRTEIKFLHDVENILKQLNFCHLITPVDEAESFFDALDGFLSLTIGSGFVVPPQLFDPSHPCSVCFEELCVTANQGEAIHRRMANKICDHITKQIRVRIDREEILRHLPYIAGLDPERKRAALAALEAIGQRMRNTDSSYNQTTIDTADAILEAHNVFLPASKRLYAISELRYWLASGSIGNTDNQTSVMSGTISAFAANLDLLAERECRLDLETAAVELALFNRTMMHFDKAYADNMAELDVIDCLLLGSRSASPDDQIEALIRACYDHHMSAPLLRRLADPDKANEDALRKVLERASKMNSQNNGSNRGGDNLQTKNTLGIITESSDSSDTDEDEQRKSITQRYDLNTNIRNTWEDLIRRVDEDTRERRKLYSEKLTKRSLASLDRCVREQRRELEKTLRINVFGETLLSTFVAAYNGFRSRAGVLTKVINAAGTVIDNRNWDGAFDAHRFMRTSLLRQSIDPAMLPSLTHKFFELVNGPLFCHDRHIFAQPPNTPLYFSVENVGLLPHLREELARFMVTPRGADWTTSTFQGFYDFSGIEGVTAAQRLAWKYIRELILATALFSSVFHCGEVKLSRADRASPGTDGVPLCTDGLYVTYETECPLISVIRAGQNGEITRGTLVVIDKDVFSMLYTVLQQLAPETAERAQQQPEERSSTE